MSEITVHPNKKLSTVNGEFQENFPYLLLAFFPKEDWEKAREEQDVKLYSIAPSSRIREIRTTKPTDGDELSIRGNTIVKNFEDNFLKLFGVYVQVSFMDKKGNGYFTSGQLDNLTLTALNDYVRSQGCQEYPANEDYSDNSSVKTDQVTVTCRALHHELCSHIHGLAPVVETRYHAKGRRIDADREYYVDIDDEQIEIFFVDWDSENYEMHIGFQVVAPEKDKRNFKANLKELCEKNGITTYEYACFNIYNDVNYNTFLDIDDSLVKDSVNLYKKLKKICKELDG